jgi:hypothetical protein
LDRFRLVYRTLGISIISQSGKETTRNECFKCLISNISNIYNTLLGISNIQSINHSTWRCKSLPIGARLLIERSHPWRLKRVVNFNLGAVWTSYNKPRSEKCATALILVSMGLGVSWKPQYFYCLHLGHIRSKG